MIIVTSSIRISSRNPNAPSVCQRRAATGISQTVRFHHSPFQIVATPDTFALVITVVYGGCVQTPNPGSILSYQGNVFSKTQVNLTTPSPTSLPYSNGYSNGLSLGAKVGISVGAILVALFIAGCCIVWNGRRRRRRFLREKARQSGYEWDAARHGPPAMADSSAGEHTPGGFFDSPQSQKPFANAWGYPQDVKSAHSLQDSPVTPIVRQNRTPDWPRDRKFPLDYKGGERIEMMGVGAISQPPPMLQPSSMR
jgi:hypothetical protein